MGNDTSYWINGTTTYTTHTWPGDSGTIEMVAAGVLPAYSFTWPAPTAGWVDLVIADPCGNIPGQKMKEVQE